MMRDEDEGRTGSRRTFLVCFLAGAAAGALLGILFAPAAGEKTRAAAGDKLNNLLEATRAFLETARGAAERLVETCREQTIRLAVSITAGVEEARRIKQELTQLEEAEKKS